MCDHWMLLDSHGTHICTTLLTVDTYVKYWNSLCNMLMKFVIEMYTQRRLQLYTIYAHKLLLHRLYTHELRIVCTWCTFNSLHFTHSMVITLHFAQCMLMHVLCGLLNVLWATQLKYAHNFPFYSLYTHEFCVFTLTLCTALTWAHNSAFYFMYTHELCGLPTVH